jgi:hypothetical protein
MWRARGFLSTLWGLVFKPGWSTSKRHLGPAPFWIPNWRRVALLFLVFVLQGVAGSSTGVVQVLSSMVGVLAAIYFVFISFQTGFLFVLGGIWGWR